MRGQGQNKIKTRIERSNFAGFWPIFVFLALLLKIQSAPTPSILEVRGSSLDSTKLSPKGKQTVCGRLGGTRMAGRGGDRTRPAAATQGRPAAGGTREDGRLRSCAADHRTRGRPWRKDRTQPGKKEHRPDPTTCCAHRRRPASRRPATNDVGSS